jgi:GAF domain-containing protein
MPLSLAESESAGHTLRTGEPTIVEDMAAETRFKPSATLLKLGVVSSLSVPIEGHDQPFGVLNVNVWPTPSR